MRSSLLVALLLASSCQGLVGNGEVETRSRKVDAFHRVAVGSGLEATVLVGSRSVAVRTDTNLQDFIDTSVENGTLLVQLAPNVMLGHASAFEVTVSNDVVDGVSASAGARVTATATPSTVFTSAVSAGASLVVSGVDAEGISIDVSGGAVGTWRGRGDRAVLVASGGSVLTARSLQLRRANIDVSGGSRLEARVSEQLSGSVSAGSTALIAGQPATDVVITGGAGLTTGLQ